MKKLFAISLFIFSISYSQNKQVLYDFAGLPQTLMLNPGAEVNYKYHIGVPLLSQISVQGGFSGFSTYDIFADDGVDINLKINNAVNKFGNAEFVEINEQNEVFYGGFQLNEKGYLSFGYYQEFNFLAKIPRDVIDLLYRGNSDLGRHYSINKLGARAEFLGVFHAGISKKINDKWQIGARVKLYSSALNVNSKSNKGSTLIKQGVVNNYEQYLNNVSILLQTSGIPFDNGGSFDSSDLVKKILLGGNLGLGFDFGFTHHFKKQWTISASLQDLGFVYNTNNVKTYQIKGDYKLNGFDLSFDPNTHQDYWDNLKKDFKEKVALETLSSNYISTRPLKLNTAVNYSFGKKLDDCHFEKRPGNYSNKVGAHLFSSIDVVHTYLAGTLFFERWFNKHFQAKISYTADPYSFTNLGLGVSTQLGPANLYLIADNLLYLNNLYAAKSASFQFGINIIIYN